MIKKSFKVFLYLVVFIFLAQTASALNVVKLSPEYFPLTAIGRPVSMAYIYVGKPDLDPTIVANQKTLSVQQEDGTVVAVTQPIRTGAGGVPLYLGSPVTLLVDGDYSLTVLDSSSVQIYHVPSVLYYTPLTTPYARYFPDYTETDQGALGGGNSVFDIMAEVGAVTKATLYFAHNSGAATTTYTFTTNESITDNFETVIEDGVILNGVSTLTIEGPFKAGLYQVFGTSITISYTLGSVIEVYPQWWGAVADGATDDATAIQAAVDASVGIICRFPASPSAYIVGAPIVFTSNARLIGSGTSSTRGSTIKLDANVNDNILESDTWTGQTGFIHWFEISNLHLEGNKANNASTSIGIAVYGMGETARIENVYIEEMNDYGIQLAGVGAPARIRNVSFMRNGVAAIWSSQTGASVTTYDSLSGDDNIIFFKFTGITSAVILNPKIEAEHDPVFDLQFNDPSGNYSQVTVVGGYANATVLESDLIKIDTAGGAAASVAVTLINFRKYNYTNIINDIDTGQAYADTDDSLEGIYQYNGKVRLYGPGAHMFIPYNIPIYSEPSVEGTEFELIKQAGDALNFKSSTNDTAFGGTGLSGAETWIRHKTVELTCNAATETWTNAAPAGAIVLGVTARVTELITGATTIDVGDADTDLYIDNMPVALGSTATLAYSNAAFIAPKVYQSVTNLTATGVGGAFTAGKLRLTLHYISIIAPTS